ncbi:hypothetical protein ACVXZ4_04200 [Lacisediminihabitans sp. FW035]
MSRYGDLSIGNPGISIAGWREGYSSHTAALFQDSEGDGELWQTTAGTMRDRLELLGYRTDVATNTVEDGWAARTGRHDDTDPILPEELVDDYVKNYGTPPTERWDFANDSAQRLQGQWGYIWTKDRQSLKYLVDRLPAEIPINFDISEVIGLHGIVNSPTFCADARERELNEALGNLPTIVITEGSTDAEFLSGSLELLRPDLVGFLTFMDFSLKPSGGTDAVVKGVRAFAASGVGNQVIGLLDNDFAGRDSFDVLKATKLPNRMKPLLLPHLALATSYPAKSTAGIVPEDINGRAVSIELFTGRDVLADAGSALTPIEWGSYNVKRSAHQGAIIRKTQVQKRFRAKLKAAQKSGIANGADWQDMRDLIEHIVASI